MRIWNQLTLVAVLAMGCEAATPPQSAGGSKTPPAAQTATDSTPAYAPQPDELARKDRWVAKRLVETVDDAPTPATSAVAGLRVLANNDRVQKNSRSNKPLKIKDVQYTRGLYCHAVSRVVVKLPSAGKSFTALVGVDSNPDTAGGRGSVVFSVTVDGAEKFKSGVVHEGAAAEPVSVDLGGATEFTLNVGDAGDGIISDQADWADAKVTLADGSELWVGDLGDVVPPVPSEPFSFTYDGEASGKFLKSWKLERSSRKLDEQRTERTNKYTDPKTGLTVRCVAVEYSDYPVVEWTVYLKNTGSKDSPILEDIQAMNVMLAADAEANKAGAFDLHHSKGSPAGLDDYRPLDTYLKPGETFSLATAGGRPTNTELPYFNLAWAKPQQPTEANAAGEGVIAVLGWPTQWNASFTRGEHGVHVCGGQEFTHLSLHPDEEIRTPLSVLLFYQGDWIRGQNIWRRWMIAHNIPRQGGKPPVAIVNGCSSHQFGEMIHANEQNQDLFIDRYLEEGIKIDYWWMDAGWYPCGGDWGHIGTWEVDKTRFPNGLRAISDHAHSKGVKTIVWFEPERVTPNTYLTTQHADWIFGGAGGGLFKVGEPAPRKWLTDHVDGLIVAQGIDLYRQDFNMDPLSYWRNNDAPDRQGINENHHAEGYLAYWDELRRRHPDMLIDTCASGGRRNDLETLRRAVPLLRSDYIMEPLGQQLHSYGIAFWIPFYGTGIGHDSNPYEARSQMCPSNTAVYDMRDTKLDYAAIRKLLDQRKSIAADWYGDYYPLTAYADGNNAWMAWQFDRPEVGEGFVQAFRRPQAAADTLTVKLRGLKADATYQVIDLDTGSGPTLTGAQLMNDGLPIKITAKPGAIVLTYKQVKPTK